MKGMKDTNFDLMYFKKSKSIELEFEIQCWPLRTTWLWQFYAIIRSLREKYDFETQSFQ